MRINNEYPPTQPAPRRSDRPKRSERPKGYPYNLDSGKRPNPRRPKRRHFPDEAPVQPNELADEYYRYYRPTNTEERDLVDSIVENEWRLRDLALLDQEAGELTVAFINYDNFER